MHTLKTIMLSCYGHCPELPWLDSGHRQVFVVKDTHLTEMYLEMAFKPVECVSVAVMVALSLNDQSDKGPWSLRRWYKIHRSTDISSICLSDTLTAVQYNMGTWRMLVTRYRPLSYYIVKNICDLR